MAQWLEDFVYRPSSAGSILRDFLILFWLGLFCGNASCEGNTWSGTEGILKKSWLQVDLMEAPWLGNEAWNDSMVTLAWRYHITISGQLGNHSQGVTIITLAPKMHANTLSYYIDAQTRDSMLVDGWASRDSILVDGWALSDPNKFSDGLGNVSIVP